MGHLYYDDSPEPIGIDDVMLAHLKMVIATKLRRRESFTLSWEHPDGDSPGWSAILLSPSIPLRFVFDSTDEPALDSRLIHAMVDAVNATGELRLSEGMIRLDES